MNNYQLDFFEKLRDKYIDTVSRFAATNSDLAQIITNLRNGTMQLNAHVFYYLSWNANARNIITDFFKNGQSIEVGLTNIKDGVPASGQWLLCGAVKFLYNTYSSDFTDADMGLLPAAMRKGELSIDQDGVPLFKTFPCELFNIANNDSWLGTLAVSPKLIAAEKKINVKFEAPTNSAAKTVFGIYLIGVIPEKV